MRGVGQRWRINNRKLLEITMRNPRLCGNAISGAGCVGVGRWPITGRWRTEEGVWRRMDEDGGRKEEGVGWRREGRG